jgi:hypothetical protein
MSSFMRDKSRNMSKGQPLSSMASGMQSNDPDFTWPDLFVIPRKSKDDFPRAQYESYFSTLCKLRDQVSLSLSLSLIHKYLGEMHARMNH